MVPGWVCSFHCFSKQAANTHAVSGSSRFHMDRTPSIRRSGHGAALCPLCAGGYSFGIQQQGSAAVSPTCGTAASLALLRRVSVQAFVQQQVGTRL